MAIQTSCPHCDASYKLPDTAAGKKFRCKECEEIFAVKNGKDNGSIQAKAPRKPAVVDEDEDEDKDEDEEEEEKPKKKSKNGKKKKKGKKGESSKLPLIAGGGVGGLLVVGALVFFLTRGTGEPPPPPPPDPNQQQAQVKPPEPKAAVLPVDANDPVAKNLLVLQLDAVNKQKEILAAVDWFNKGASTSHPKNPKVDHPLRGEVAKALELLIDHQLYELRDECWEAWTKWVVPEDLDAIKIHIGRAPKAVYRVYMINSLARFQNEEATEILAMCLLAPERDVAAAQLQKLGSKLAALKVKPYFYHAEEEIRDLAFSILKSFKIEPDSKFLPRLPEVEDQFELGNVVAVLQAAEADFEGPAWWRSALTVHDPVRNRKLAALGWLQRQLISLQHWKDIAQATDPMVSTRDQFKRVNALLALERWANSANIGSLAGGLREKLFKKEHHLMLEILTKIPDPAASTTIMGLLPDLEPKLWAGLGDYMKSLSAPESMKSVLVYFNYTKDANLQMMSRAAVLNYRVKTPEKFTNDDIIEQCKTDLGGENPTKLAALGWLATSPPPMDKVLRKELMESLKTLSMDETPENGAVRSAAARVMGTWGRVPVSFRWPIRWPDATRLVHPSASALELRQARGAPWTASSQPVLRWL